MQNQNIHPWPWGQGAAPPFPSGQPLLPTSFPPPGLDQNPLLSGYQQMYANPPAQNPPDYGQWTAAQLQQWQQWQQWQEKYQQWQAQYGKKYAESLAAFGQSPNLLMPGLPPVMGVPKPVEPASSFTSVAYPPLPPNTQPVPPPPPDEEKPPLPGNAAFDSNESSKIECQSTQDNPEELSEAEKTFDTQFKQWEGQFNEWKKQNQDHPDKAQYKEYEKKWETWREQLLQRREQMRKKRLNKNVEQQNEINSTGKGDDSTTNHNSGIETSISLKSSNLKYDYKMQAATNSQAAFTNEPSKLENIGKPSFFEKSLTCQSVPNKINQTGKEYHSNQDKNSFQMDHPPPSNFSNFSGEKSEPNKLAPFANQNFNRNQGLMESQKGQFDGGQDFGYNQVGNIRLRNFQDVPNDANVNLRFRNSNFNGPRFAGNFENFQPRLKSTNEPRNFGSSQRFFLENFRNDRDISQQRLFDTRDQDVSSQNFNKNNCDLNDFRAESFPLDAQNRGGGLVSSKPKVPSLFDITVEKPPSLVGSANDRKPKVWEKFDKKDYFDEAFDKRLEDKKVERNEKAWSNNNAWAKNVPSPWMQPWELEKMAPQKPPDSRPWDRKSNKNNGPWMTDILGKQEIDKVELSGYVGNILAKLGNFNVVPPNITKNEASQDENTSTILFDGSSSSQSDANKRINWNDSVSAKDSEEAQNLSENCKILNTGDSNFRTLNLPSKNFALPVPKDFDERDNNFSDRLRNNFFAPTNFDRLEENKKDPEEKSRLENVSKRFDIDERISARDDRLTLRKEERFPFNKDDSRHYGRPCSRDDRRNFTNDDRFFGKDERSYGRVGRDERSYGRFNTREDIDDRFNNRNGKRSFDRFDRDDRFFDRLGGRGMDGFFDRYGRNRDHSMNEPVWNPQVFEYSQGHHQNFSDSDRESGFKISTVVDYSHGENKQTFDYGHGESTKEKQETKSFDYDHKAEAPCVIDYGHGVDRDPMLKDIKRDKSRDENLSNVDGLKSNSGTLSPIVRSNSPRAFHRSRSKSPHSRFKRGSKSPTFKSHRSRSRDRLGRAVFKRDRNDSEGKLSPGDGEVSKHSFEVTTVLVEDLICLPGREARPSKLVFIMRGIPGSGKTYVTKLIKDKEVELGGDPPRILSLDDYFMTEIEKEVVDKETGRKIKTKVLEYEYEAGVEPHYRGSLLKAFKKTVSDGFFSFIIVDSVNEKIKDFEEMWSFAKQKGFQVYIAEMDNDVVTCKTRNIHKRTEKEISDLAAAWEETPSHFLRLDVRSLLQSDAITEVEMEVVSDTELEKIVDKDEEKENNCEQNENKEKEEDEEEDEPGVLSAFTKSRWDQLENSEQNLDRLDGLKRRREGFHATMEDYLQLPDDFDLQITSDSAPGKKRVRWADLEEKRQQEKMRAIGFVVGQTDWSRMTDPTFGESALTRTKYI